MLTNIKLVVFDLDDTLANIGEAVADSTLQSLNRIIDRNIMIAVSSGKPVSYLSGLLRQAELNKCIIMGENGAVVQIGNHLPPEIFYTLEYPNTIKAQLQKLQHFLEKDFSNELWFQPNQVGLTPFYSSEEQRDKIRLFLKIHSNLLRGLKVFENNDSFDIIPENIDKGISLLALAEKLGISANQIIAVGNGQNDLPLFEVAGYSVGIGYGYLNGADVMFSSIEDCLNHILKEVN